MRKRRTLAEADQMRLAAVVDPRPDSTESFNDVYPIDVGSKPVEHAYRRTYGFFFDCVADVIMDIRYERTFARTAVVFDSRGARSSA